MTGIGTHVQATASRRGATIAPNVPPRPPRHRVPIAREYLRELAARVRAVGIARVAKASGLHKNSVRRTINSEDGRNPTLDTIAAIRRALEKLEPDADPPPPPLVAVRGVEHARYIALADKLTPGALAEVTRRTEHVIRTVKRRSRSRK